MYRVALNPVFYLWSRRKTTSNLTIITDFNKPGITVSLFSKPVSGKDDIDAFFELAQNAFG